MPQPSSAIPRPDLGVVAHEYEPGGGMGDFIALQVLPDFPIATIEAYYPQMKRETMLKLRQTARAPRGKYNRAEWDFDWSTVTCKENGWEEVEDDVQAKRYRTIFDYESALAMVCKSVILRRREKRVADAVFNTSTWTPVSLTNEWDDADNATPIDDINTGKKAIRDATGLEPDTLIVAYSTSLDLGRCAQVVDQIKYSFPGVMPGTVKPNMLAQIFQLERVLVGKGVYDSADLGQDASITDLWSNEYAMLCRVSDGGINLLEPCLGRSFRWSEDSPVDVVIEEYRDEESRATIIRGRQHTHEAIVMADAGYLMDNVTT